MASSGRSWRSIAWALVAASAMAGTARAVDPPPDQLAAAKKAAELPGRLLLADSLIDEARVRGRNTFVPPELAVKQATVLLEAALQLNPDAGDGWRMLAEASLSSGNAAQARECFRNVVRLDPGNLVAQVQFLDLIARGKPVDEQMRIYSSALQNQGLDPQVRSEMAVRVGHLALQAGQAEQAGKLFQQALVLNDVNVMAWQEICRQLIQGHAKPTEQLQALISSLAANPFQPETLQAGGRVLALGNQHRLAADWLGAALEQYRLTGGQAPGEALLELAVELAAGGRRGEADGLLRDVLLKVSDGPTVLPMLAMTVRGPYVPPVNSATAPATSTAPASMVPITPLSLGTASEPALDPSEDPVLAMARKRAAAAVAANAKSEQALVDAIWVEVYYAPKPNDKVDVWLEQFRAGAGDASTASQRLQGWRLLQIGKTAEAKAILKPLAAKDPLAAIGVARIAAAEHDDATARDMLQDVWNGHPTGMLAVMVVDEAQRAGVVLQDTPLGRSLAELAKRYPDAMLRLHRQPKDVVLVLPKLKKFRYEVGEPIILEVSINNAMDHALAAGPAGVVNGALAIGGNMRGVDARPMGVFALESAPRTFRLERQGSIKQTIRADQGTMRSYLYQLPNRLFNVGLVVMTNPRMDPQGIVPGLGGQRVIAGEFSREGFVLGGAEGLVQLVRNIKSLPLDRQMIVCQSLQMIVYGIAEDRDTVIGRPGGPGDAAATQAGQVTLADARQMTVDMLVGQLRDGPTVMQAWLTRNAPFSTLPAAVGQALGQMSASKDPIVRMVAYTHALESTGADETLRAGMSKSLKQAADTEADPLAKRWAEALSAEAALPLPTPATAPATAPATRGGSRPGK